MKIRNNYVKEVRQEYLPEHYPMLPLSDPAVLEYFGVYNYRSLAGIQVNEKSVLGIPAVWRAVSLISGTIAGLPLKTYRDIDGERFEIDSHLDNPGLELLTPFEWKELALVHLLLHGNAFFLKVYTQGGTLAGLQPVHPTSVAVAWDKKNQKKFYKVQVDNGAEREFSEDQVLHIKGLGTDILVGHAPLTVLRLSFASGIAAKEAAGNQFGNGLMIPGMFVAEQSEELTAEQARIVQEEVESRMMGPKNAGKVPVVNKNLKYIPMSQINRDAQFVESQALQVEDYARVFGIPPHLLAQTEKQTSWGTGVSEQNLGLQKYTLQPWTKRIEERLTRTLPRTQFCEFEYKGLFRGTPKEELEMLKLQYEAGFISLEYVQHVLNLPRYEPPKEASNGSDEEEQ